MKRYCLTLDLIDDPALIREYEQWHRKGKVFPEVIDSINDSGILSMEIFRAGNRLCMIMETEDEFSFERKSQMDAANDKVQEWERMMWTFQQAVPGSAPGEKWILMERIFKLEG